MNDKTLVETDWQKAVAETNRLQRELDITNADHIALWIEANTIPDEPMNQCASWLACRIVEAHEKALQSRIEALEAALRNPPMHKWWGAGEPDCPPELKAPNGELWRVRCKVCGNDISDGIICQGGLQQILEGSGND